MQFLARVSLKDKILEWQLFFIKSCEFFFTIIIFAQMEAIHCKKKLEYKGARGKPNLG
jgi:hypothetical protein